MRQPLRALPLVAAPILLWTVGCGSDPGPSAVPEAELLQPQVHEVFRVGSMEGGRWDSFSRVASVAFDGSGNLFILDGDTRRLEVVSPEGEHLRSIGRPGEGPGELRSPMGLAVLHDGTTVVLDLGHRSFLLFTPDGEYLRSHPLSIEDGLPGPNFFPHGNGVVGVLGGLMIRTPQGGTPENPSSNPIRRYALDSEGEDGVLHEAWRPPPPGGPSQEATVSVGGGSVRMGGGMARARAFEPATHLAVLPDGRMAVADTSTYRIHLLGPAGGLQEVWDREIPPMPVGEAEREAERRRQLRQLEEGEAPQARVQMQGPGGGVSLEGGQLAELFRARIENMTFWPEIPVIEALSADAEGRLWVQRSGGVGAPGLTDLFDGRGRFLGSLPPDGLRIPDAFGPDGLAAWIELDEFEVPYVRVRRIEGLP